MGRLVMLRVAFVCALVTSVGHSQDRVLNAALRNLRDKNAKTRMRAADTLARIGHNYVDRVIPALEAATKDKVFGVKIKAIKALGATRSVEAVPLLEALAKDKDEYVVKITNVALKKIGPVSKEDKLWLTYRFQYTKLDGEFMPVPELERKRKSVPPSRIGESGSIPGATVAKVLGPDVVVLKSYRLEYPREHAGFRSLNDAWRRAALRSANAKKVTVLICVKGVSTERLFEGAKWNRNEHIAVIRDNYMFEDKKILLGIQTQVLQKGLSREDVAELVKRKSSPPIAPQTPRPRVADVQPNDKERTLHLAELQPTKIRVWFGDKNVEPTFNELQKRNVRKVAGVERKHVIWAHPVDFTSSVMYSLERQAKTLVGAVGLDDGIEVDATRGKMTFVIRGDGRVMWTSNPVSRKGQIQPFRVDVTGVKQLELVVRTTSHSWAHAVWIDPIVSR